MQASMRIGAAARKAVGAVLRQGLGPEEIALTICLGSAVGTMPILWGTTPLCALLAARLRLNHAAIQAVNYLLYPVQLSLIYPFVRMGQRTFPFGPAVAPELVSWHNLSASASIVAWATLKALGAWLLTVPPLLMILYPLLAAILRRKESPNLSVTEDS